MRLLSFSVSNFRSIRATQTLSLYHHWQHSTAPKEGWEQVSDPITVLIGSTASGKSSVLNALAFALLAIESSATAWLADAPPNQLPHAPYRLDPKTQRLPSTFELEFDLDGVRYLYGFQWSFTGVHAEWLSRVPSTRWSPCFVRTRGEEVQWTRSFMDKGDVAKLGPVTDTELILSAGLRDGHPILAPLARALVHDVSYLPHGHTAMSTASRITTLIRTGKLHLHEAAALLRAADAGIHSVRLNQDHIPEHVFRQMRPVIDALSHSDGSIRRPDEFSAYSDAEIESLLHAIIVEHKADDSFYELKLTDESGGTQNWMATAPLVLDTLRRGGILVADELDSALRPALLDFIIHAFREPSINVNGAQLIFASHAFSALERAGELGLRAESFWSVEKTAAGESELHNLSDTSISLDNPDATHHFLRERYGTASCEALDALKELVRDGV
ncbi:ATP-binding protein [Corynebacterium aurimucosum]|uniref:AAA family ATPase n=1 Tax=Corynebacterium aurimucosum TaxID=169292 RepID=UPI001C0F1C56|nr:ATP-binding protein [Corynebacterium aurimucosum]MBU5655710.1 ATP-binding protein [Corynebacterium aurimucosum]